MGASGNGAGMDIVVSSVKAYIGALNKMLGFKEKPPVKNPVEKTAVSAWGAILYGAYTNQMVRIMAMWSLVDCTKVQRIFGIVFWLLSGLYCYWYVQASATDPRQPCYFIFVLLNCEFVLFAKLGSLLFDFRFIPNNLMIDCMK